MNLKIGGNSVGKIMYGSQEIGGATKLEPGTILYIAGFGLTYFKDAHLFSTTKKWENINGINIALYNQGINGTGYDIVGDDFKNLDIEKEYKVSIGTIAVSRSIIDGEYRLNVSSSSGFRAAYIIRAI